MEGVIHIQHFGAQLRSRDGMYTVFMPDLSGGGDHRTEQFAPAHVQTILLHPKCSLTTDAVLLAERHGTTCLILDEKGEPTVFLAGMRSPNALETWKRQLELQGTPQGLAFARDWLCLKVQRKMEWLPRLRNYRKDQPESLNAIALCADALAQTHTKLRDQSLLHVSEAAASLRGIEGQGQKAWLALINFLLPRQYKFDQRSRQPSRDLFNAMLNYGYGILYNWAEKALWEANVNPYFGFMHSSERKNKALLYDFIEPYRPWMDRAVFKLCSAKEMLPQHTEPHPDGGLWLTRDGKRLLANTVYDTFRSQKIQLADRNWSLRSTIGHEARQFSSALNRLRRAAF